MANIKYLCVELRPEINEGNIKCEETEMSRITIDKETYIKIHAKYRDYKPNGDTILKHVAKAVTVDGEMEIGLDKYCVSIPNDTFYGIKLIKKIAMSLDEEMKMIDDLIQKAN
jgi:hypothetical protein